MWYHSEKTVQRGNKEVIIIQKQVNRNLLIPTSKQILAQGKCFVKAGTPLSEGAMTPADILAIKGPMKVQELLYVYRLQGVKINDKHFIHCSSDDA